MNKVRAAVALLLGSFLLLLTTACGDPPKVVQGIVVKFDPTTQTLVLRDEQQPDQLLTFSVAGADIGADPVEQDEVRLAYREKEGTLVATRVMNLTRQKEVAKQK